MEISPEYKTVIGGEVMNEIYTSFAQEAMQRAEKYLNDVSNKSNTLYYKKRKGEILARSTMDI